MDVYNVIGYLGAFFLTITFIPQTTSLIQNDDYSQIRYMFLWNAIFTSICLGMYGLHHQKYPIVIGNSSVFINSVTIMILKYRRHNTSQMISTENVKGNVAYTVPELVTDI